MYIVYSSVASLQNIRQVSAPLRQLVTRPRWVLAVYGAGNNNATSAQGRQTSGGATGGGVIPLIRRTNLFPVHYEQFLTKL